MIERIVAWSVRHRIIVLGIFLVISAAGVWAISTTPLDAIPDLSENQVIVYTEYMGRSPQIVEDQVTFPLVSALQGLAKVKAVRAQSMFGMSFVYIIFDENTDLYWARSRVLEKLSVITPSLPSDSKVQLGPDGTGVGQVFWYTVEGKGYDLASLRAIQDWYIKPQLQAVEGVSEVASVGGYVRQYQINVDPNKLREYGVDLGTIRSRIVRANNDVGGKIVEVNGREGFVRGQGYFQNVSMIRDLTLSAPGGAPITIGDVANVELGPDIRRGALDKNGMGEATGGVVVMRMGENAKTVIDRVKEKIAAIEPGLAKGVKIVPAYDRSELIEASVANLEHTLVEEAIIVTLIVVLFLLHIPSAMRVVIEIPVSVLIAFILMRLIGISSNIMSLGGIAIGIGVLVDSSIVMLENAHRHLAEAQDAKAKLGTPYDYTTVVLRSATQVARPIFFSLLIIVISFLPVFMLSGQEGKLFHPLAYTKTFSLLGSALVSITLVPVLMTLLMRGKFRREADHPISRFFIRLYRPVLEWVLRHRSIAIGLNLLALAVAVPIAMGLGSEFMPPLDEGSLLFMPTMIAGVSLHEALGVMQREDAIIKTFPEVKEVLGKIGRAETPTDPAPVSMVETLVLLKPKSEWRAGMTKAKIVSELSARLQFPGVANSWTQPIINRINMLSTGVRTDIGLKFFGSNLDTLDQLANEAAVVLKKVRGATDVIADRQKDGLFLDIKAKTDAAARYGLSQGSINDVVEGALGGIDAGTIVAGRERFPILLRYNADSRSTIEELRALPVSVPSQPGTDRAAPLVNGAGAAATGGSNPSGESSSGGMSGMGGASDASADVAPMNAVGTVTNIGPRNLSDVPSQLQNGYVPLGELATIRIVNGPSMIASEQAMLRSLVYLNIRGRDPGSFVSAATKAIDSAIHLPVGYTTAWSGEYENQVHAASQLRYMIPMVFVLIFLLLLAALKDPIEAGVVMLSVPFALIGGVFLVAILGYNWSVAVWIGFIALYGVAVETGVVMVVYLHEALDKRLHEFSLGLRGPITRDDIYAATMEGAVLRLRPKLMTVATAMLGLIPILWSTGVGSDVMRPIAAPMIGGMLTSAVHVLIITPILFIWMKQRALDRGTLRMSELSGWMRHG